MSMLSNEDLILLNEYLDGRLAAGQRQKLEARLAQDAALRAELDGLRETVGLLRLAERVTVPRSFTLDPARYGSPDRPSLWDRLGLSGWPGWAFAGASLAVALMCIGAVIIGGGLSGGAAAPSVAMQPALEGQAQRAAAPQAAHETAAEAPAGKSAGAAMEPSFAGEAATPTPSAMLVAPLAPPAADSSVPGGVGGGAPQPNVQPGAPSGGQPLGASSAASSLPAPTQAPLATLGALPTPTTPGTQIAAAPKFAPQPAGGAEQTTLPAAETATARNYAASETPAKIDVQEAQPFKGLTGAGWLVLIVGTAALVAVVLAVTLLKRRPR